MSWLRMEEENCLRRNLKIPLESWEHCTRISSRCNVSNPDDWQQNNLKLGVEMTTVEIDDRNGSKNKDFR